MSLFHLRLWYLLSWFYNQGKLQKNYTVSMFIIFHNKTRKTLFIKLHIDSCRCLNSRNIDDLDEYNIYLNKMSYQGMEPWHFYWSIKYFPDQVES